MKNTFVKLKPIEFRSVFSDEEKCLEFLAGEKWQNGFVCRKCGHTNFCKGKTPHSRRCTRCKHDESATAHTIFHRCKIPLTEAFEIAYLVCSTPGISSYDISRRLEKRQMTCWKFKKKITECIERHGDITFTEENAEPAGNA
ncbi:MAG: transposase [Bacteroidales bacterium]